MRWSMVALGLAFAASGAQAQSTASFKDWHVVCDNLRSCTAFGFSPEEQEGRAYLKLSRGGAGDSAPEISVRVFEEGGVDDARDVIRLTLEGGAPLRFEVPAVKEAPYWVARLTRPQAQRLAGALANGTGLTASAPSGDDVAISLAGSAAALLQVDDKQRRLNTTTALVRRGPKAPTTVPALPPLPVVRRAAAVSQARLPVTLPPALRARADVKACAEDETPTSPATPLIDRLGPRQVLWGVPCGRGAYNESHLMLVADEAGRGARLAPFVNYPGYLTNEGGAALLVNAGYDPATRTLGAFSKGRGIADCGGAESWVWDGAVFRLTEGTFMGECKGVPPDDWPVLWRAEVR